MLPLFKKAHISSRAIFDYVATGRINNYSEEANKRNALRQASALYTMVDGELYRRGSNREYKKYGLRTVIHDDEPERKREIIENCHVDAVGHHLGMNCTIKSVSESFYWQGISAHVKVFLKNCEECKARSKLDAEEWVETERRNLFKKSEKKISAEAKSELKNLGRIRRSTPPETFFIVNAQRNVDYDSLNSAEMLIDSNNIEFVIETLGYSEDGAELDEICHVLNVPDIVPVGGRCRSREIENFLKHGVYPEDFNVNQRSGLRGPASQYTIIDNELYHEGNKAGSKGLRLVIHDDKPAQKVKIMVECHLDQDGTHNGLNKTTNRIGERYFWIGMSIDVRKFLLSCKVCSAGRGRRNRNDGEKYKEEVRRLKERQSMGGAQDDTITMYSQETGEQITTTSEAYNQIIQLVGPGESDITEITVAVVDGEFVPQKIQEQQTNMDVDVVETHTAMSTVEASKDAATYVAEYIQQGSTGAESTVKESGSNVVIDNALHQDHGIAEVDSVENGQSQLAISHNNKEETASSVEAEALQMILKQELDIEEMEEVKQNTETQVSNIIETDGCHINRSNVNDAEQVENRVTINTLHNNSITGVNDDGMNMEGRNMKLVTRTSGCNPAAEQLFQDIIFVPNFKKSRAIQLYLEEGKEMTMHSRMNLKEIAQCYELKDNVIYRRPSPYKARQILIHDDQPKLKLNIIQQMHIKPSGEHNSELITGKNLTYKYYWDEVLWDIYRYFIRCTVCVKDGKVVKTGKPVLTLAEKKRCLMEKRPQRSDAATIEMRNHNMRLIQTIKLARQRLQERYRQEQYEAGEIENMLDEHAEYMDERDEELEEGLDDTRGSKTEATSDEDESWDEMDARMVKMEVEQDHLSADQEMSNVEISMSGQLSREESDVEINIPTSDDDDGDSMVAMEMNSPARPVYSQEGVVPQKPDGQVSSAGEVGGAAIVVAVTDDSMEKDGGDTKEAVRDGMDTENRVKGKQSRVIQRTARGTRDGPNTGQKAVPPYEEKKRKSRDSKRNVEEVVPPVREDSRPRREIKRPRRFSPETVQKKPLPKMETEQKKAKTVKTPEDSKKLIIKSDAFTKKGNKMVTKNSFKPLKNCKNSDSEENSSLTKTTLQINVLKQNDSQLNTISLQSENYVANQVINETNLSPKLPLSRNSCTDTAIDSEDMVETAEAKLIENLDNVDIDKDNNPGLSHDNDVEHLKDSCSETEDFIGLNSDIDDDDLDDENDLDENEDDLDDIDSDEDEDIGKNPALNVLLQENIEGITKPVKASNGYTCSSCSQQFVTEQKCSEHCRMSVCRVRCELCGKTFKDNKKEELKKHKSLHESEEKHLCETCKKEFFDAHHLSVHQRSHMPATSERCTICSYTCHTSFLLASHMLQVHNQAHMFSCDICRAKFVNINFMKPQVLFDGQMSYFKCVMCPK